MSKLVKEMITDDLKGRLEKVTDLFVVDMVGLDAIKTQSVRKRLREKNIHLMMVKNSLARRATEGTALAPAFEGASGMLTIAYGASDVVALAKEITKLADDKTMQPFAATGGVMGGAKLSANEVKEVSKWPTREEQLSMLVGQILSPGAKLASQLNSVGGAIVSQIKEKAKESEGEASAA